MTPSSRACVPTLGVLARLCLAFLALLVLSVTSQVTQAQELDYMNLNDLEEKIFIEVGKANELLAKYEPPRYKVSLFKVELSVVHEQTVSGGLELRIPAVPVGVEIGKEYKKLATIKETYTYKPRESIPVSAEADFGLLQFIIRLHADIHEKIKDAPYVRTEASREMSFLVEWKKRAGVSIFVIRAGGQAITINIHKIKFVFCLVGGNGECVDSGGG